MRWLSEWFPLPVPFGANLFIRVNVVVLPKPKALMFSERTVQFNLDFDSAADGLGTRDDSGFAGGR